MTEDLAIRVVTGDALRPYLDDVARLRLEVFRAYPYLYDGSLAYERRYLDTYASSADTAIVLAVAGDDVVGASTCVPMRDADAAFATAYGAHRDVARAFYFGESLVRPAYRGRGVYRRFFEERERRARETAGIATCAFCAIERPDGHPLRPRGDRPLHAIWTRYGYERRPEIAATYAWKDVDRADETEKRLVFWLKDLAPRAATP